MKKCNNKSDFSKVILRKKLNINFKILVIFLMGIFITSNSFATNNVTIREISNKNGQVNEYVVENEENYTDEYKRYIELSDEEKAKIKIIPRKYKVPLDMIYKDTVEVKEGANLFNLFGLFAKTTLQTAGADELPPKYNLRDYINIKTENQGTEGLCWAFTCLKSLETNLAVQTDFDEDLSEMHLGVITVMYNPDRFSTDDGGNFRDFKNYLLNNKGPVREQTVPYAIIEESEYDEIDKLEPIIYVEEVVDFPYINKAEEEYTEEELRLFREKVKEHIMNSGSIFCAIKAPDEIEYTNYSAENLALYQNKVEDDNVADNFPNHGVSIIGWDDTYSKDNFNENNKPEHDGAYIALNSWGKTWGDNGVFYISYDDIWVESQMSGVVKSGVEQDYKNITFNDRNFYNKIKEIAGKQAISFDDEEQILTVSKLFLNEMVSLEINEDDNIQDVTGLENFTGLIKLSIENVPNINENYLTGMKKLDYLELKNCGIDNIDFINNMPYLTYIDLSGNSISNILPIQNLKNLEVLNISDNTVSDIEPLVNLKNLKVLKIRNISEGIDLNILKDMENLTELDISGIDAIENLDKLTNLVELSMDNIDIKDNVANQLRNLINSSDIIENLSLENCSIVDVDFLNSDKYYNKLNLSNNPNINLNTLFTTITNIRYT